MPFPENLLKQIKCCLNKNDKHTLVDPVLLKCGGNACKECVTGSIKCLNCNETHLKGDFIENKLAESLIRSFMKDQYVSLDEEIDLLKGFYLFIFNFRLYF